MSNPQLNNRISSLPHPNDHHSHDNIQGQLYHQVQFHQYMMNLVQVQDKQQYIGLVLQWLFRDNIQSHNHDRVLLLLQKIKSLIF